MGLFGLTGTAPQKPASGGSWILPPGAYVCRVETTMMGRTMTGKDKMSFDWSVAEGEYAGWGTNTMYPPTENIVLDKENPKTLGYAVYKLNKITESNPGRQVVVTEYDGTKKSYPFDAVALVDNNQAFQLNGALIGFVIGVEDYTKTRGANAGQDGERNFVAEWLTPQEVRQGYTVDKDGNRHEIVPPPRKDSRKRPEPAAQEQPQQVQRIAQAQPVQPPQAYYANGQPVIADADIPF